MVQKEIPNPPKLFFCEKCELFFFSFSKLDKPSHSKCFGHKTRLATKEEIDYINDTNKTHIVYNELIIDNYRYRGRLN